MFRISEMCTCGSHSGVLTQCAKCAMHTGTRIVKTPKISGEEEMKKKH